MCLSGQLQRYLKWTDFICFNSLTYNEQLLVYCAETVEVWNGKDAKSLQFRLDVPGHLQLGILANVFTQNVPKSGHA
jgi:hypothetical protein